MHFLFKADQVLSMVRMALYICQPYSYASDIPGLSALQHTKHGTCSTNMLCNSPHQRVQGIHSFKYVSECKKTDLGVCSKDLCVLSTRQPYS
jgi:hypothetical protein